MRRSNSRHMSHTLDTRPAFWPAAAVGVLLAVVLCSCKRAPESAEPPAPVPPAEELRLIVADWPDGPADMSVAQLKAVGSAEAAFAAAMAEKPDRADLAGMQLQLTAARHYLDELDDSVAADVAAGKSARLVEEISLADSLAELWPARNVAWRRSADVGQPDGEWIMGHCFHKGVGVDVDYARAMAYYRPAAEAGHVLAMNHLAYMYQDGEGVDVDVAAAVRLHERAAEAGDPYAMLSLGEICEFGVDTVAPDRETAIAWYKQAAARAVELTESGLLSKAISGRLRLESAEP